MGLLEISTLDSLVERARGVLLEACGDDAEMAFDAAACAYQFEQRIRAVMLECVRVGREKLVAESADKRHHDEGVEKWVGDQIARKSGLNCRQGHRIAHLAAETAERLRPAFNALSRGELDYAKLDVLARQCDGYTDDTATAVQDKVLAKAPRCSTTDFRRRVRRQVLRIDPETAAQRRKEAARRRRVEWHAGEDDQATVILHGPAEDLRALVDYATKLAKNTPTGGRCLDEIRFDVLRDLILGGALTTAPGRATLNVTVELETLLGLNEAPANLDGYGPIIADVAREIAKEPATYLRRLTTINGKLAHLSDRYRPTKSQADYCHLRDPICPWPGCNHPASSGDLDHGKPYRTTKTTDTADLVGWCRRHHLLKTLGFFDWTRQADGRFTITLHNGSQFTT